MCRKDFPATAPVTGEEKPVCRASDTREETRRSSYHRLRLPPYGSLRCFTPFCSSFSTLCSRPSGREEESARREVSARSQLQHQKKRISFSSSSHKAATHGPAVRNTSSLCHKLPSPSTPRSFNGEGFQVMQRSFWWPCWKAAARGLQQLRRRMHNTSTPSGSSRKRWSVVNKKRLVSLPIHATDVGLLVQCD